MARHKKVKRHHKRRHRVGAAGATGQIMDIVALTAGAAAGALLVSTVRKQFATMPKIVAPLVVIAAGAMVPRFVKTPIGHSVGNGLMAIGGAFALSSSVLTLPGITGVGMRPYGRTMSQRSVGAPGFSNQAIGAVTDPAVIGALSDN